MKFFICSAALCFLSVFCTAQVQFVSPGNNSLGTQNFKIISFKSDGASSLLHEFKISDPMSCGGVKEGPDGKLYGTTYFGGSDYNGVIFSVNQDGTDFKTIYNYVSPAALKPIPEFGPDGKLYIVINDKLYSLTTDGAIITTVASLPLQCGQIVIDDSGWLYGIGQSYTINSTLFFKIKIDGSSYQVLHTNNYISSSTEGAFMLYSNSFCFTPTGRIFMTCDGGPFNGGTLVSMRNDGTDFIVHKSFGSGADYTKYGLVPGYPVYNNGKIVFNTFNGGSNFSGAMLSFDTATDSLTAVLNFNYDSHPASRALVKTTNNSLIGLNQSGLYSINEDGTNRQQINTIKGSYLTNPFYSTSSNKVFYIVPGGTYKDFYLAKLNVEDSSGANIHSFGNVPGGYNPGAVTKGSDGLLYGITTKGGARSGGTIYQMNSDGSNFKTIKDFNGNDGEVPSGQLLFGSDGKLYGVCRLSGIDGSGKDNLLYTINTDGTGYAVLQTFTSGTDGDLIPELAEGINDELFGVLVGTGNSINCKIFKVNKNGTGYSIIRSLSSSGSDGFDMRHGLVLNNSYLYGVTTQGGTATGSVFRLKEDGTDFSVIKYFGDSYSLDGSSPEGSLALGTDNRLYGSTRFGGSNFRGTIFSINPADLSFKVQYHYTAQSNFAPAGKMVQASDGKLYQGSNYNGTLSIGTDGSGENFINPVYKPLGVSNNIYLTEIPLQSITQLCPAVASTVLQSGITASTYQWQLNSGTGFINVTDDNNYTGSNSESLLLNNIPSSWTGYQFRCIGDGKTSKVFKLQFTNSWTGTVNTAWENTGNWSCGKLPDNNTDVSISGNSVVVINSNVTVRSLQISSGAKVTVAQGYQLTVLR